MKYTLYSGTKQSIEIGDTVKLVSNGARSKTLYTIVDTVSWNKSLYKVENNDSKLCKNVRWDNMIPVLESFSKTVPAVEVKNKFIAGILKPEDLDSYVYNPEEVLNLINSLNLAFSWARSPQGFDFWSNVNVELHNIYGALKERELQKKFDELNVQAKKYGFKLSKD